MHTAEPASEVRPEEHAWHTLAPVKPENVPAAQEVQEVDEPSPYVPSGQGVQPAALVSGTQYVPDPQQTELPVTVHWL